MGIFSRSISCEKIAEKIAYCCLNAIENLPSDIFDSQRKPLDELRVLIIAAHRLAIQFSPRLDKDQYTRVLRQFDRITLEPIKEKEINDLLNKRGRQYFQIFNKNIPELNMNNSKPLYDEISFVFPQFCGGGEIDEGDPLVLCGLTKSSEFAMAGQEFFFGSLGDVKKILSQKKIK
ncbi:MAG: hypothetical protein Q7I97_01565 [Thermovirgaceae bacterium]|nr:hypothetical protein [Thermovirgaceae bacterium]